jgi:probable HAF family extracellular repeat protein
MTDYLTRASALAFTLLFLASCNESPTEPATAPAGSEVTDEAAPALSLTAATYQVVKLGSLGGVEGEASAMNLAGQIVGQSETQDGQFHAFIWQNGVMRDLGTLPNQARSSTRALNINGKGQVVGFGDVGSQEHALLWQNGTVRDLGTLGGLYSRALDINPNGVIVGFAQKANGKEWAFRWINGTMQGLGTLGGRNSAALGINGTGQIVGRSQDQTGKYHAFIWQNGVMRDLGGLGGQYTQANAINGSGQIVGYGETPAGRVHAILWSGGKITDLGVLPNDQQSYALDIDNEGRVTGYSEQSSAGGARTRVFLWENGQLINLGYTTGKPNRALGISPEGNLVGSGTDASGRQVPVLWRRQ